MVKKLCLFIFPILSIFGDQDYRKWKNQEGKIIEAKFIKFNKDVRGNIQKLNANNKAMNINTKLNLKANRA